MPVTPGIEAPLIEVFSSIQGEGVLVGCRQIFVRFAACNLDCAYCDTAFNEQPNCRIETQPGSGVFASHPNPFALADLTRQIEGWQQVTAGAHHSLVLTGGEPLLHADILVQWLPEMRTVLPIYLESNGTLPAELAKMMSLVDYISMDIKGESTTGFATPWQAHTDYLMLAKDKLCQVKLVVDAKTSIDEVVQAAALISRYAPDVPFVLQPRTAGKRPAIAGPALLRLQQAAAASHPDVRVIPQIHPLLGVA